VIVVCAVAAMMAVGGIGAGRARRDGRLARIMPSGSSMPLAPVDGSGMRPWPRVSRLAIALLVLVAGVVAVGGVPGMSVGLAAASVVVVVRPTSASPPPNLDDVPVVVDLVAGCLAAGASLPDALDAASAAADVVMRAACCEVATALRSGAPPEEAWRGWLNDPHLAPVARTAVRTTQTGAAAAADLRRTSSRLRAQRRANAQHRVRQASVWLVVPLGLCFLPAFILVAVVPLVVGLVPSLR
jgi:Flp pilus assembly protein TadB